jgi:DNA mismatch repair protein MutL
MRIQVLSPILANQIAAGEVIERPASVVKELVENSLDAGATEILIEIEQGGHDLIRVRDNGSGIHSEDLALSLDRHATSKIASFDDLMNVTSLGFRGEALASIAAISRLKMSSKKAGQDSGFYVQSDGGHILEKCAPIAHPVGTTVEIRELFFNTPARKKFLRKATTEFSHIEAIILRLALSHFSVAFTLKHNEQIVFQSQAATSKNTREKRILDVMGQNFMSQSMHIDMQASGLHIWGWIGLPTYSRTQTDLQYFYVNKRFVRDKLLMHAARSAYQDVLFGGRHPAYVLFIEMDPTAVDVNVHPTKHEVRFRDQRTVHDAVRHAIKDAIEQVSPKDIVEKTSVFAAVNSQASYSRQMDFISSPSRKDVQEQMEAYAVLHAQHESSPPSSGTACHPERSRGISSNRHDAHGGRSLEYARDDDDLPLGHALGQIHSTFIVAQNSHGMILVDMHAAHERILYEKLKLDLAQQKIARQTLLIPITLDLTRAEMAHWENTKPLLSEIGIASDSVGPQSIAVREIPFILKNHDISQLMHDILSDLETQEKSSRIENTIDELLGNIACKAALKAHHTLSLESMNALLRQMETTPKSCCCNHGRPTWVQLTIPQLDQFFMRGK